MRSLQRIAFGTALSFLTVAPSAVLAADNIAADLDQPLWYQAPSAKTLELAKIDDLSSTVVSDGQRGRVAAPAKSWTIWARTSIRGRR